MGIETSFLHYLQAKPGDDAAALFGELVCACDSFVEGSHFKREWLTLADIATKALSVNVSDIYTMGAIPHTALLSLSLPPNMSAVQLREMADSLRKACARLHICLVGGDTIASPLLGLHFTLIGRKAQPCESLCVAIPTPQHSTKITLHTTPAKADTTHQNRHSLPRSKSWILRKGILRGDVLCVSGTLGKSAQTLNWLLRKTPCPYSKRHAQFYARRVGSAVVPFVGRLLHASMDISDGLTHELERLAKLNHLGFKITKPIPKQAQQSGEEYEALVAVSRKNLRALICRAKAKRVRFMPIAIATLGAFKGHCKEWH